MKFYKHGKDAEGLPCVELDSGTTVIIPEVTIALAKALVKKGVLTLAEIKAEL